MTELEITALLQKLKKEPRYTMHKGKDTEFYVTSFSIIKGIVNVTTSIDKHAVPQRNF